MAKDFSSNNMFSYGLFRKQLFVIGAIISVIVFIAFILTYFFFLRESDLAIINIINSIISHLVTHIKGATLLGALYASLIGGLFFVIVPLEALFLAFLASGNNGFLLVILYVIGFIISFSINYYIGFKLSETSRKIITPKKFYKIKGIINRYGSGAIFVFNLFPLPAQPLAAILGVFRYNKARFYTLFIMGQLLKYSVITIGYFYIV